MVGVVDVEGGAVLKLARFDTYESKARQWCGVVWCGVVWCGV